jgi:hypothetical protein
MAQQIWSYPALIAVLGQQRRLSFGELRTFVKRVRHEAAGTGGPAVMHRCLVRRVVMAALTVPGSR